MASRLSRIKESASNDGACDASVQNVEKPSTLQESATCNAREDNEAKENLKKQLFEELMLLDFKIRMCKNLRKAGLGYFEAIRLKKKWKNIYYRKLKIYCEITAWKFIDDVVSDEINLKIRELQEEMDRLSCSTKV